MRASAVLLVLAVVLSPVYSHLYTVRDEIFPACVEATGLILAFLAVARLHSWRRVCAGLLLFLHSLLFVSSLWHMRVNLPTQPPIDLQESKDGMPKLTLWILTRERRFSLFSATHFAFLKINRRHSPSMKLALFTLILLVSPVCRGGPIEVEPLGDSEATALFGLPFTDDSQFAQINHRGQYQRRLTVRPFAPSIVSVRLQMFEPVVRAQFTDDICQPDNAFYPYHE